MFLIRNIKFIPLLLAVSVLASCAETPSVSGCCSDCKDTLNVKSEKTSVPNKAQKGDK